MKPKRSNPLFAGFFRRNTVASAIVLSLGFSSALQAQTLYWDTNQDSAGSGNVGGIWDLDAFWTEDANGLTTPTTAWIDGRPAVFSTGTDGTGAWTVTINSAVTTPSILLKESGAKTISGGTINIGGGTINTAAAGNGNNVTISSIISGAGGLTVNANGDLSDTGGGAGGRLALTGANDFTGNLTITGGLVQANSGFGAAANKIVLDGGGLLDSNLNVNVTRDIEIPSGKTGFYRTYGGVTTGKLSGAITGAGSLRLTDGGTRTLDGNGSAFTGTLINTIGTMVLGSTNWAGTTVRLTDNTNVMRLSAAGDTSIKSLISDRDVIVPFGSRLNIVDGTYTTVGAGTTFNGFWAQGTTAGVASATGELTSSSGTLTITNGAATGDLTATDNRIRLKITDFGSGPNPTLALVKNNQNVLNLDQVNTYTGGTTINGGRINADNVSAFGTGLVTVNAGGQAYLTQGGTYANDFAISGIGVTEGAGNLGAIRLENTTVSGDINVASASRIVAYGTTGILTGALTGTSDLDLNLAASPGTLTFSGDTSGYTGTMTLNAGTLNLSGTVANIAVGGGATLNLNNGAQIGTPGLPAGSLRTLNVNSGATVAGNVSTVFSTSEVNVNLAGTVTGNVSIDDSSTLGLRGGSIGGSLTSGFDGASNITWNLNSPVAVTGDVTVNGSVTVNLLSNPLPGNTATVLTYGGTFTGAIGNFAVANPALYRSVTFTNTGAAITLSTGSGNRTWAGNDATSPTFWDATTVNWTGGDGKFFNGDAVLFNDDAVGTAVDMQTVLLPYSVTFNNTTKNFTVGGAGSLSGSTGITKNGTGAVTLGGANGQNYTGPVAVNAGVLNLGSRDALGQSSGITIASGAQVNLNGQSPGSITSGRLSWTIAGQGDDGAGNEGAITNTGAAVFGNSGILNLTLSGDAELGSNNGRFDVGLGGGAINGAGFTLTKTGSNQIVIRPTSSTNITFVINQGELTFEDYNAASGTNPITVNAGVLSTYGPRTIGNNVTLAGGTTLGNNGNGTGTWTGTLTASGTVTVNCGSGSIALDGALAGTGNLTRSGANTLFLQADASAFSGKITSTSGGTLRIEGAGSLGTATGADVLTLGGGTTLQGGTSTAQTSATIGSATQGITLAGNVNFGAGANNTLTINSPIAGTGNLQKNNNAGDAVIFNQPVSSTLSNFTSINGTTEFNQGLTLTWDLDQAKLRTESGNTLKLAGTSSFRELEISTATVNIGSGAAVTYNQLEMSQGGGTQSVINQTGGTVNFTGTNNTNSTSASFLMGHWGSGSGSTYNLSGGSLNAAGAVMSLGWDSTNVNFNQSGGTANFLGINLANGRNNTAAYTMTGGRINLGATGITNASAKSVNLGGGTVGAFADWSSAKDINLTGTNGNVTFNTLDSVDGTTPRTITLTGVLSGTGGLLKQGAGNLVISNAAGTFNGTAEVAGGSLFVNSSAAVLATLRTSTGGTLRPGTPGAVGTALVDSFEMNGGDTTLRVGPTKDLLDTLDFTVSSASTISVIPTAALTAGQTFDLIVYSGAIGGLGAPGITLNPIANPHYSAALDSTEAGFIKLNIISADTITWTGATNGNWDVNTTPNWKTDSNNLASNFYAFDVVKFDDTGANPNITLTGTINPASVEVNAAQAYSFSGSGISGNTGLTKAGTGTLTLLNDNSYLGAVAITGGAVVVGNGGTTGTLGGSGAITVNTGASLTFNRSNAQTLARQLTGGGTLVNSGGNFTLNAANNSVDIVVNSGTFFARGGGFSTGFAPGRLITVNSGATLDTVTHSMGSSVGGGGDVPRVTLNGGSWQLNNEQYMRELTMTAGTTSGPGDIRTLGGSVFTVNAAATSSTIGSRLSLNNAVNLSVADGAAATDLLISGDVFGGGAMTKSGAGTLVMTSNNTATGALTIAAGVFQIGAGGTTGSLGTGAVTNNASLVINRSDNVTVSNVISGTGSLTKKGTNVLTLSAVNTYSGNTVVEGGTLAMPSSAGLRFVPTTNGTSNRITGSGGVELGGTFTIDLSGANLTSGNSWTLVDVGSLSSEVFLSSFAVAGFTESANVHTLVDGANTWTFSEATGVLSLAVAGGYDSWAAQIPNAADRDRADDPDGDGFTNLQEFLFGTSPVANNGSLTTTERTAPTTLVIRWKERVTGADYTLLESATLANPWTVATGALIETDGLANGDYQPMKATVTIGAGKNFFRVEGTEN